MTAVRPRRPWDRTPPEERDYFEVLGPGLVVVLPPRSSDGGSSGGWTPPTGGAWIHVGEEGTVRAFTGKAEVGQGTRGALALVVAGALGVPYERVEVVMGDTDLCPWDIGTFGSRSMPDAAPALAAAATAARAALLDLSAQRPGRAASELPASSDEVRRGTGGGAIPYVELVRGGHHLVVAGRPASPAAVGPSPRKSATIDRQAEQIVTGRQVYASDVRRPGMLYGALLWPPSYGAHLKEAHLDRARSRPGVTVVQEGEFVGVAAPTVREARDALRDIDPRWERPTLPAERGIEEYLRAHPASGDSWDSEEETAGNVEAGLATAAFTVRATYRTAYIAHVPLEPHAAVAEWEEGRLTVWVGSQTPFRIRAGLARALQVPEEDVRVIVPATGSGFGGKHGGEIALAAARLARAAGRPVRVAFSREEEFRHAYFRPMSVMDLRAGMARDGSLVAWEFLNVNGGAAALLAPYRVANRAVHNVLSDSPLPQGSYRALGANANNFARESAIDELACQAGLDPLAVRDGALDDPRLLRAAHRAADRVGWAGRVRGPGRGFGLAVGLEKDSRVATVAEVTVSGDRHLHVDRLVTAFDAGSVVDPENLRSQVEGSQVMALGGALFEQVHFDAGVVQNPRLSEYRVPRFSDVPTIEVELIDDRTVPPAGAGETPMIAVAPAVANAIFDATGVRLRALPLIPAGKVPSVATG